MLWEKISTAPKDGSIILTDEGCVYYDLDFNRWLLCSPTWRNGKPEHFHYSCADNGAYEVEPVIWIRHPHDTTKADTP